MPIIATLLYLPLGSLIVRASPPERPPPEPLTVTAERYSVELLWASTDPYWNCS
jgi:hypothetical protein